MRATWSAVITFIAANKSRVCNRVPAFEAAGIFQMCIHVEMKPIPRTNTWKFKILYRFLALSAIHSSSRICMYMYPLKSFKIIFHKTLLNVATADAIDTPKQIPNNPKRISVP